MQYPSFCPSELAREASWFLYVFRCCVILGSLSWGCTIFCIECLQYYPGWPSPYQHKDKDCGRLMAFPSTLQLPPVTSAIISSNRDTQGKSIGLYIDLLLNPSNDCPLRSSIPHKLWLCSGNSTMQSPITIYSCQAKLHSNEHTEYLQLCNMT